MNRAVLVAFAALLASQVHASTMNVLQSRALLHARQTSGTDAADWGVCPNECAPWTDFVKSCAAKTDPDACLCTKDFTDKMTTCFNCIAPLAAAGASSNEKLADFPKEAQSSIDQITDQCAAEGHPIEKPTFNAQGTTPAPGKGNGAAALVTGAFGITVGALSGVTAMLVF